MYSIPKTSSDSGSPAKTFFAVALVIGAVFYTPVVIVDGWEWFVVPLGMPAITYWHAWGLAILRRAIWQDSPTTVALPDDIMMKALTACASVGGSHLFLWMVS